MLADILTTQERMIYSVASEKSETKRYRVDLLGNGGAGECSCVDFGTRRQTNLDAGLEPLTQFTVCKHLRKVQRHFLLELLIAMAKSEES